jgi:hypothetical protein
MFAKVKPLFMSIATGSGVVSSLAFLNEILQTLGLLCSLVLGVVGLVQLFKKKKK